MQKTKVAGYLMILIAVLNSVLHFFQGQPINYQQEAVNLYGAVMGSGLIFARSAIQKVQDLLQPKK